MDIKRPDTTLLLEFLEFPIIGRSLAAVKPIKRGQIIVREQPLICYPAQPTCRSSVSPFFSKRLWKDLCLLVEEFDLSDSTAEKQKIDDSPKTESHYLKGDHSPKTSLTYQKSSLHIPGIPSAIIAFLRLDPPLYLARSRHTPSLEKREWIRNSLNEYYYPDWISNSSWLSHPTIHIILSVVNASVDRVPECAHLDANELARFVLRVYSNAHSVSFDGIQRSEGTHARRRKRRYMYEERREKEYMQRKAEQEKNSIAEITNFDDKVQDSKSDTNSENSDSEISSIASSTHYTPPPQSRPIQHLIGIFPYGSKFAHSCAPSVFTRYDPQTGDMLYTSSVDISSGDLPTISYLSEDDIAFGGIIAGGTEFRRGELWRTKFFFCQCKRCERIDLNRGMEGFCKWCEKTTTFYPIQAKSTDSITWLCSTPKCQQLIPNPIQSLEFLTHEVLTTRALLLLAQKLSEKSVDSDLIRIFERYISELQTQIPKAHWAHSFVHRNLALYRLHVLPTAFGRGFVTSIGGVKKGLHEAVIYLRWLDEQIISAGNELAGIFAGYKLLECIERWLNELEEDEKNILLEFHRWLNIFEAIFPAGVQPSEGIEDMKICLKKLLTTNNYDK